MKKIVTVLALAIALSSCSNDDDKNKEEFFNLKVGNHWVYKKYNVNNLGEESYSGTTDTVKVAGVENIEGKDFYRLTHTNWVGEEVELIRVDEKGHLISSEGYVKHPGTDKNYTESRTILEDKGVTTYTLKDITTTEIEGVNYELYPYSGYFIPSPQYPLPEGEAGVEAYAKGIGFVIRRYWYISHTSYFEYRLVSYDLK